MHHAGYGAVKVGITAADSDRIERFLRRGWTLAGSWRFTTGAQARDVERAVLRHLRVERGLRPHLAEQQTSGTGGSTETFAVEQLLPADLLRLVAANCRAPRR